MIYITGDTHGEYDDLIDRLAPYEPEEGDIVIVAGDFGFIWFPEDMRSLDKIKKLPYTVAIVDGNHENFDILNSFPVEKWNGGDIHRIAENIIHLMRGQLFEIEGKTVFTMGGAYSTDKAYRREGRSWWSAEQPSAEEYDTARATLERCSNKADIIITHTLPRSVIHMLGYFPDPHDMELTWFFERLYRDMKFRMWFGGHFHEDRLINGNFHVLYHDVVPVDERVTG